MISWLVALVTLSWTLMLRACNAVMAALLLFNLIPKFPFRPLNLLRRAPLEEEVFFEGPERKISADFYRPSLKKHAAVLLIHGLAPKGKKDMRLVNIARTLARGGFTVMVPDFTSIKKLDMRLKDLDEVKAAFRHLLKDAGVHPHKCGVMGFSYSATLGAMLASDPKYREKVAFLGFFGGYYSGKNMLKYLTTGQFEYKGQIFHQRPDNYARMVFRKNIVSYLKNEKDKQILTELGKKFENCEKKFTKREKKLYKLLSSDGLSVFRILMNKNPERFDELYARLPSYLKRTIDRLSLEKKELDIHSRVLIGHGTRDPQMPWTESQRFYDALPDKSNAHMELLGFYSHVDFKLPPFSWESLAKFYLPEIKKIYSFVYDFLWQSRA